MAAFLFFIGGIALFVYGIGVVREGHAMSKWPIVPGKIVSAIPVQITRAAHTEDQLYSPEVEFEFTYLGVHYRANRIALVPINSKGPGGTKAILSAYAEGQAVQVHVNPEDPTRSVLDISMGMNRWAYLLSGLCMAGLGVRLFTSRTASGQRPIADHRFERYDSRL